jgi:hypothetical protein
MDYARLRLLQLLRESDAAPRATVAADFTDVAKWLPGSALLLTYVAGPHPDAAQDACLREWLEQGGRWLGLHGTAGGRAAPVEGQRHVRRMVKGPHHATLGSFFLNHPPIRRFQVDVVDRTHALTRGLPEAFEVDDELYLIELQDPARSRLLLTTELEKDPSPPGFGFAYHADTSLLPDGRTRALGYVREHGRGAVAYLALGHCHSPDTNSQPFVDATVSPGGRTPPLFRGAWESAPFERLLRNAIEWGCTPRG